MPKRKEKKITIDDDLDLLVEEIKLAENDIKTAVIDGPPVVNKVKPDKPVGDTATDLEGKRSELIRLSEDGEIDQSVKHLQKASAKIIEKIHKQMEIKRLEKTNAFITDLLISKFADLLGGLNAIESSEVLNDELQKDKLLKKDVEKIVSMVTPYVPALGIVSGGVVVGKHVVKHHCDKIGDGLARGPFPKTSDEKTPPDEKQVSN